MNQEEAQRKFDQAAERFKQGDFQGALELLNELEADFPGNDRILEAKQRCIDKLTVASPFAPAIPKARVTAPAPGGASNRRLWIAVGMVALVAVAGVVYWVVNRGVGPGNSPGVASESGTTSNASSTSPPETASDSGGDYAWLADLKPNWTWEAGPGSAPDFSERVKKGMYDPLLGLDMESMVVPDVAYPDGKATIWVPKERARQRYLTETTFVSTPAYKTIPIAKPEDVNKDKSKYGYFYVTGKIPSHLPQYDYAPWNEEPIYPFIGQKVPGTDDVLVDVTPDGNVVPALTTLDHRSFRSINWPRERYVEAVYRANRGKFDSNLSGPITEASTFNQGILQVGGIVRVSTDVWIPGKKDLGGQYATLSADRGACFVVLPDAKSWQINRGSTTRIDIIISGNVQVQNEEQLPVIFTSGSEDPRPGDWNGLQIDYTSNYRPTFLLIEYSMQSIITSNDVRSSIIRYSELIHEQDEFYAYALHGVAPGTVNFEGNELHHNKTDIIPSDQSTISRNTIYGNLDHNTPLFFKGIYLDHKRSDVFHNVIYRKYGNGIAPEDGSTEDTNIHDNICALNEIGVNAYHVAGAFSRPRIENNTLWANFCTRARHPEVQNVVGGPEAKVSKEYERQNKIRDPGFSNAAIYDLRAMEP